MNYTAVLKKALQTAGAQIFSSGHLRDTLTVTKKCQEQAKQLGLTEADVKTVYNQGSVSQYNKNRIEKDLVLCRHFLNIGALL